MKPSKSRRPGSRYEFRAWTDGAHGLELLESWAQSSTTERFHDCYLIGEDPTYNVKVRDGELKLKHLIDERRGFQLWNRLRKRDFTLVATPLESVIDSLEDIDDEDHRAIADRLNSVLKSDDTMLAVPVSKKRRLFRSGLIRGEVTEVKIAAGKRPSRLTTVAIEGPNLRPLVALRASLGLADEPNRPYHVAVGAPKLLG